MATLDDLLQRTLLFKSQNAAHKVAPMPASGLTISPINTDHTDVEGKSVWRWTSGPSTPSEVTGVYCTVPGHGIMKVCEKIGWTECIIVWNKTTYKLKLTKEFCMGMHYLLQPGELVNEFVGITTALSRWWLTHKINNGVLAAFAYELARGSDDVKPVDVDATTAPGFFPEQPWFPLSPTIAGDQAVVTVSSPIVVVFVSVVFCAPARDFEPGELLLAARLLPHAEVMCSFPLGADDEIKASLYIQRPAKTTMLHGDKDMSHAMDDTMHAEIKPLLVTDRNGKIDPKPPEWDEIFDYFSDDPEGLARALKRPTTRFTAVDPARTARTIKGAVEFDDRSSSDFDKRARQGEFDNLHLAPRMKLPARRTDVLDDSVTAKDVHMDEIAMAPFCAHDCLHTHWRWGGDGEKTIKKFNKGWGAGAYALPGAPMVPPNQTVEIELDSLASFYTHVTARGAARPGARQVFNPQGSAYSVALNFDWIDDKLMSTFVDDEWFLRYWKWRYAARVTKGFWSNDIRIAGARERIKILQWADALR